MKKYFYLMALLAIAPLSFTSCSGDDDDDVDKTEKPAEITLKTPENKDDAVKYTLTTPKEVTLNNIKVRLHSLELTESGNYILTYEEAQLSRTTRDNELLSYFMGYFTKMSDGSYKLVNFGHITVTINGSSCIITLIPNGDSSEPMDIEVTKANTIGGSEMTNYLCRTWTVTNTRIRGTIGGATVARDFKGTLNMNEIIDYAKSKGAKISDTPAPNTIVKGITFTSSSTFAINYQNGKYDMGTWRWVNQQIGTGEVAYSWNDKSMGSSMEKGQAFITLSGNECKLQLPTDITDSSIEMVCTMQ